MTSLDALERMAAQVLHPARSTNEVNLTTLGAEVAPSELMAAPGFIPDAVADVDEIGGVPTHEELVREVFDLRQIVNRQAELIRNLLQWRVDVFGLEHHDEQEIAPMTRLLIDVDALMRRVAQLEKRPCQEP